MTTGTENGNGAAIAPNTVDLLLDEGDLDRDELYELSLLVGIDPENAPSHPAVLDDESGAATDPDGDSDDAEELVDRDVLAGRVHADGKTRTPIWANPLVKAGSVALIGGLCMAVVGGVLSGFQSAGKRDLTPTARPEQAPEPPPDPTQLALERQRQEIGQLKTRNALGNQTQALQLHEARTNGEGNEPSAAELLALRNQMARAQAEQEGGAQPAPNAQTAAAVSPQSVQPTGAVTRPAPTYAPAAPRPAPAPRPNASSPPRQPVVNRPPPPAPEVLWASLAAMGSYGTGTGMEPTFTPGPQEPMSVESLPPASSALPQQPAADGPTAQLVSDATPASLQIEEAAILGRTLKRVAPGTTAAATLVAPIYWAEDLSREQQSQRTAIALSQPLLADNGAVALDVGTVLVAEVSVLAGSGMVELSVTDVVTVENGVSKVTPVPLNHLLITGGNGNPLIAKEMRNGAEVRAAQMQLAALGALGHVGELLNRPLSQQTIIGEGASAVATEYAPVNIIAGLLSGAAQAVLPIEQQRVTQRIDDYDSRNRIWFHDTAEVSVFALNEFVFEP